MDMASRVRFSGPLTPYASGFEAELSRLGYTPLSATAQLRLTAELSRHLQSAGLPVLTEDAAAEFLAGRRTRGCKEYVHVRALGPLLEYLRGIGAVPLPARPVPQGPAEELLAEWERYLAGERGLTAGTRANYLRYARPFLSGLPVTAVPAGVSAADVVAFMVRTARELTPNATRYTATALRSLLRFMHVRGLISGPLAGTVPHVSRHGRAGRRMAASPRAVTAMLDGCDRSSSAAGRRDYAVIVLLARLGLRAGEVAALTLDDLDWQAGLITVHGKGRCEDRMPLPPDAGAAVAAWLRDGRPPNALDRHVFTRLTAPRRGLTPAAMKYIVASAAERAGTGRVSPHQLRHFAATATLASGAPLDEVRQVLRHQREATTALYASVGTGRLRPLARPWPGSVS